MLLLHVFIIYFVFFQFINCGEMHAVIKLNEDLGDNFCAVLSGDKKVSKLKSHAGISLFHHNVDPPQQQLLQTRGEPGEVTFREITAPPPTADPLDKLEAVIHHFMFGPGKTDNNRESNDQSIEDEEEEKPKNHEIKYHYPSGNIIHAQLFRNKSSVHLPPPTLLHRDHCKLRLSGDHMQTAVNAFGIILWGGLGDIKNLPRDYVLRSARAIAMMVISREKYAAMWDVVLNGQKAATITVDTLQRYRPLFKYLSGKQIARLNLSDDRIVSFIGTHPELNRHQVGVVANKYINLNKNWSHPKYLNVMNNLLCGIPMTYMRKVSDRTFLQLAHQVFYHIRACDPLQKRFYLSMMTKTQALGKAYSWSARDVSRLGLLMAEVDGSDLAAINPESMSGLNAQVMNMIPAENLVHITEMQFRYIRQKPLNILAKKLKAYHKTVLASSGYQLLPQTTLSGIILYFVLGHK